MKKDIFSSKKISCIVLMFFLTLLSVIVVSYIPVLSDVCVFILPIPLTVLYVVYSPKISLISLISGIILSSIIYNPIFAIMSGITIGLGGLTLGYCIKGNKKSGISIVLVSISTIISNIIRFLIYALINKQGIMIILKEFTEGLKQPFINSREVYVSINASSEIIHTIDQCISFITINNILMIIPIIIIINSFIQGYINYLITEKVIKKLGCNINKGILFRKIYISNRIIALFIIIECLGIIANSKGIRGSYYIANMTHVILVFALTVDGMAYLAYILIEKLHKSKITTALILIVIVLVPIFSNVYFLFGIIDILFNLRKLDPDPIRKIKLEK